VKYMTQWNTWHSEIHDTVKYMTQWNTWQSGIHDRVKYMTEWNIWQSEIHDTVEYMTEWNTWHSEIHDTVEYMTQWNTWQSEIHDIVKYMTQWNTWHSEIHDIVTCNFYTWVIKSWWTNNSIREIWPTQDLWHWSPQTPICALPGETSEKTQTLSAQYTATHLVTHSLCTIKWNLLSILATQKASIFVSKHALYQD